MKLRNKILGIVTLLMLSVQAHAVGLMIEPYVGISAFNSGEQGATENEGHGGLTYGARIGLSYLGFWLGGEYSLKSGHDIDQVNAGVTTTATDVDTTYLGVTAGYNFPVMLRTWITYNFAPKQEDRLNNEQEGSGFALGLGWTGLPFVSLNLEYRTTTYDTFISGTTGLQATTIDDKYNEVIFSVSLPFNL